ncbi:hypothetical protein BDW75DRAFT_207159 [Aspergillus navahoensis]
MQLRTDSAPNGSRMIHGNSGVRSRNSGYYPAPQLLLIHSYIPSTVVVQKLTATRAIPALAGNDPSSRKYFVSAQSEHLGTVDLRREILLGGIYVRANLAIVTAHRILTAPLCILLRVSLLRHRGV